MTEIERELEEATEELSNVETSSAPPEKEKSVEKIVEGMLNKPLIHQNMF